MAMLSERDRYHNYFFCKSPIEDEDLYPMFERVMIARLQRPALAFIELFVAAKISLA